MAKKQTASKSSGKHSDADAEASGQKDARPSGKAMALIFADTKKFWGM